MDITRVRGDFPILSTCVHGRPLVYLDNGATTQLPLPVLEAVEEHYRSHHANIHRGIHALSEESTARVEAARGAVAEFIGADPEEIIFTSGTTGSVNLVARSFAEAFLLPGDLVVATEMEHHSNLIPWQEACRRTGAALKLIPVTEAGELDLEGFCGLLEEKPKLVAVTCVSNVLGTVNPVEEIITLAHQVGAKVLLDAAQAMRHCVFDVKKLDCDFLCFSGHKMMAPTGVGVLYGKRELLERMPPVTFGGGMVDEVEKEHATYGGLPFKFEAGTVNIAGIIGLKAAIDYLNTIGPENIAAREAELTDYLVRELSAVPGVRILGAPKDRAGVVSFILEGVHCFDAAKLLDQLGVAVRSGHHCAQPLLARFGLSSALRATPAFYNTKEEIDALAAGLRRIGALLKR